ncbi:hypothetical protein ACPPVW_08950 [Leifsonia sp. McL0607]|uniref:hypothetical protein n=1 Tax=Leifsonia sp. McL0607 TaxID=3415672 RepID=UPI003CF6255A
MSAFAFTTRPDGLSVDGARGLATWTVELEPGTSTTIGFTLAIGRDATSATDTALDNAGSFDRVFDGVRASWERLWHDAFRPGNTEFSGYLPTLVTPDRDLARTYYLGALLAVYMRNTEISSLGPVFLTGGPRLGATTTFFWDQAEWARTAALLEPAGMRAWIVAALSQPYDSSHSFDTYNLLPIGNHYASNDHSLFRIAEAYVGITGDLAVLDEYAGRMTVIDHLRKLAYRPRITSARFGDRVLVDFGDDAWELLECVPNYRHAVVSFNAGYVGMLRGFGDLLRLLGDEEEAAQAEADADRLAAAVVDRYAGHGRWSIMTPHGGDVIGHCLDFALVAAEMSESLSGEQRSELVDFVSTKLIDGDWMRALDPSDSIAPLSDRPDHGAAGAFAAWPGATAYGLCRLGRPEIALGILQRAHRATSGALWGQAMEVTEDGGYRVAERGISNRESNAAVAMTEAVIGGLFGIEGDFGSLAHPAGAAKSSAGTLRNVRAVGFDLRRPVGIEAVERASASAS